MTGPPPPPPYGPPPGGGQPPAYGPPPGGGQPPPYGPPPGGGQPPAYGPPGGLPPPPPLPYPDGYVPPPPPKSSSLKWWLIGGIGLVVLLVLAVVGFVALSLFSKGNTTATDVTVGQCLAEIPSGDRVVRVQTTGCDQPHAGEVFAVLTMPDGPFPGQAAVEAYHERCGPALAAYSPSAMADDSVQLYVLYPTADTWSDGDRTITCIATLDPPRTGSIRG